MSCVLSELNFAAWLLFNVAPMLLRCCTRNCLHRELCTVNCVVRALVEISMHVLCYHFACMWSKCFRKLICTNHAVVECLFMKVCVTQTSGKLFEWISRPTLRTLSFASLNEPLKANLTQISGGVFRGDPRGSGLSPYKVNQCRGRKQR